MSEIDINAIAADASVRLVKDACASALNGASDVLRSLRARFFTDFEDHILSIHENLSKVKIITGGDRPINFTSIYTPSNFTCAGTSYKDDDVMASVVAGKRCVLSGHGGAGKSFMMRHVWLEVVKRKSGKVPVLVELRRLNSLSSYDMTSFIRAAIFGSLDLDETVFRKFCEKGLFVFLFDGFDEVSRSKREELEAQILLMSRSFPKCGFVVSGRPDDRFSAWVEFYVFKADPFDYDQFKQLIDKVPFEQASKKAFQKIANERFFIKHKSFLSNPLLSLMMLLTFRDNAEIPTRLSSFYENCFSTLYGRHDALKEAFSRQKSLDQLRFKRVFSAFSLLTYLEIKPSLNGDEFISSIEKSKSIANISVSVEDIRHDLLESVNLIVKEGDTYSYIHRSFQEYFAAHCVVNVLTSGQAEIIDKFARRSGDQTLRLTHELHPMLVEDQLIIPLFRKLKSAGNLPRRSIKTSKFNAAYRAGLNFKILVRYSKGRRKGEINHYVYGFGVDWVSGYDVLSRAALVAKYDTDVKVGTLHRDLIDDVVMKMINAMNPDPSISSKDLSSLDESMNISVNFTPDSFVVSPSDDSDNEVISEKRHAELIKKCRSAVQAIAADLDDFLTRNNKEIFASCEGILRGRDEHNRILFSAIN
ncbi:NACHT domain-containing protein [Pseudomonas sp. GX19020]|uniref:NACHT domain-containing protein n=1 Tax=Pseudomonas sp. GX19020 TaxID=2942277 RepID=UPI002019C0A6|nr:NACHT domain-containing protein [Pseudomonas sp. GX19020]MCL4068988.1 NACHT domain-containing protein [Pseudomonas sp. GX19020]